MKPEQTIISVAVAGPMRRAFSYRYCGDVSNLSPGQRLLVPFGRSRKVGFYLGNGTQPPGVTLREVIRTLDDVSYFPPDLFAVCLWMADYYFANPADCLTSALPPFLKRPTPSRLIWQETDSELIPSDLSETIAPGKALKRSELSLIRRHGSGLLTRLVEQNVIGQQFTEGESTRREPVTGYRAGDFDNWKRFFSGRKKSHDRFEGVRSRKDLLEKGWSDYFLRQAAEEGVLEEVYGKESNGILEFVKAREDVKGIQLTAEQQSVIDPVLTDRGEGFKPYLLFGVTGSGKTLVYCHLAMEMLQRGKTVLVLTPEISISGTTLAYFRGFFGSQVTVIHSAMSDRERKDSWQGIRQGRFKIVIGPRSALFAPLPDLGLIVVDEEHDESYKQTDPAPRFQGRDSAVMRARLNGIPVILGSASPSLESFHHTRTGRYTLLSLTCRPAGATLPVVRLIDMRRDRLKGDLPYLSYPLKKAVETSLSQGRQAILYLNRRGYSPQMRCLDCGHLPVCPECRLKLTYHKSGRKLICHFCGYSTGGHADCEKCGGQHFQYEGTGTQKVEEAIPRLFSQARVARFDSDNVGGRSRAYRILEQFERNEFEMLLGTQMVTKGLDIPNVALVGVLAADLGLDLPDFRSSEKGFARLLQVAGRSGRSSHPGEVLIQTYTPDEALFDDVARQDFVSFYEREIVSREQFGYPPFARLVNITFSGTDDGKLRPVVKSFAGALSERIRKDRLSATLLGPTTCPLHLLRRRYRRHLLVKTTQVVRLGKLLTQWEAAVPRFGLPAAVRIAVDVDPYDLM
jgi:primosomal protein N' (replication factor Y)